MGGGGAFVIVRSHVTLLSYRKPSQRGFAQNGVITSSNRALIGITVCTKKNKKEMEVKLIQEGEEEVKSVKNYNKMEVQKEEKVIIERFE